jgi:hypothetical protein
LYINNLSEPYKQTPYEFRISGGGLLELYSVWAAHLILVIPDENSNAHFPHLCMERGGNKV